VTRHALRRAALGALAAALLVASPAAADPFFEPDEAPVDSLASLELDLNHGCFTGADAGDDGGGGHSHGDDAVEQPTVEVALQVPDEVDHVEPADRDGWELEVELGEDDRVEVITWLADEGTSELAPVFGLEAVHRGEVGDEVFWPVFQGCEEGSYRWVATTDEPEGDPAPSLVLVEADPDAPAPEPDEPDVSEEAEGEVDEEPTGEEATDEEPADEDAIVEELDAADAGDEGLPGWVLVVVLLVVVAIIGVVLAVRSRSAGAAGDGDAAA
jgi:hypothetical protein